MTTRLARMRQCLEGLSVGDAFGEQFAGAGAYRLLTRALAPPPWRTTDDTEMACEIASMLEAIGRIDQDLLARRFANRWLRDPDRGYAGGAIRVLRTISNGEDWRVAARASFGGAGSLGNGAAMRAAPIGAFFSDDSEQLLRQVHAASEVTHAHPEGIAGAAAVALAAAWATNGQGDLFEYVLDHLPSTGSTREGVERARALLHATPHEAANRLGNGSQVTAPDTVPFCLWVVRRAGSDFADALWTTASEQGDVDTTCAIVGGILALRTTIPAEWIRAREPLRF